MLCAGAGCVDWPAEQLVVIALALGLDDRAQHRRVGLEHHDRVGPELDRDELIERDIGDPSGGEPRKLDAEELTQQVGGKRRLVPDQIEDTFVE
jgi:hypothetical protein